MRLSVPKMSREGFNRIKTSPCHLVKRIFIKVSGRILKDHIKVSEIKEMHNKSPVEMNLIVGMILAESITS